MRQQRSFGWKGSFAALREGREKFMVTLKWCPKAELLAPVNYTPLTPDPPAVSLIRVSGVGLVAREGGREGRGEKGGRRELNRGRLGVSAAHALETRCGIKG